MDGSDFVNKDTSQMQKDNVLDMKASEIHCRIHRYITQLPNLKSKLYIFCSNVYEH